RLRLSNGQSAFQTADCAGEHSPNPIGRTERIRGESGRAPEIHLIAQRLSRMPEPRRHHSDDNIQIAVRADLSSKHVWIGAEQAMPSRIADHDSFGETLCLVLLRSKDSAEGGFRAQQREVIGTHSQQLDTLGVIRTREVSVDRPERGYLLEYTRALLHILKLEHRHPNVFQLAPGEVVIH